MKKLLWMPALFLAFTAPKAQVTLQPVVPAVGMIQKAQLWNILVVNSSSERYDCRLDLVVKDRYSNLELFTATTGHFELNTGTHQFNINSFDPVQYNYLSQEVGTPLQGLLPVGSYIACYSLTGVGLKAISLADECVQMDVEPLSPPMLINPADSTVAEVSPAQFSWIPPAPTAMFNQLSYEVIITPINPGQKAAEAIQENVPIYSQGNLATSLLNYTAAYSTFEKDQWYAWQIIARDNSGYAGRSEVWVFKTTNTSNEIPADNAAYLPLNQETASGIYNIKKGLKLKYYSYDEAYNATVQVMTTSRKVVQSVQQKIKYGVNYFTVELNRKITPGETYLVQLSAPNGKNHTLTVRWIQ